MRPNLTGQASLEASQRFKREAEVTARLRSPHTVNLFDFGIATDGAFYYAMELLDGVDAEALVKRFGSMPYERVIHTIRQVCHSLSEAHSLGLVHRDIKPANIFLCRYGEEFDFVKVLDFGIVSAVRDAVETRTIQTTEHAIRGTPAFMAPEQAMGVEIDARADIYATGCLAYWLLTGKHVFTSDSPMGLLVQHAQATPPPPSARTDRPIPRTLDHVVMSCLAKDPAQRPQSARELSQQLGAIEGGQTWTPARAREWWQANDVANGRRMA
jgi:serine/threonine-protein kinase